MPRPEKYSEILECQMTKEEINIAALELAKVSSECRTKTFEKAEALKKINEEIKAMEGEIVELTDSVITGKETRTVDVKIEYNFKEKKAVHIRLDTGEVLKETEITEDELQESLV